MPAYRRRWAERLGWVRPLAPRPRLWLHAVSVGEIIAAAPLVRMFQARFPRHDVLITTTTPTGSEQVRRLFADAIEHCYLPYDLPDAVGRFLRRTRPTLAVIMETELWPNLYQQLARREIPLVLVNARMSLRSVHGYLKVARLTRGTLGCVTQVAAQGQVDAERLLVLGLPESRLRVTGNIKFDVRVPQDIVDAEQSLRALLGAGRPVWIAGSTHAGEEELVLQAHRDLLGRYPAALLVLVPRHPERFERVAGLCQSVGLSTVRRSQHEPVPASVPVLLGDTMGELLSLYGAADIAFVGGSMVPGVGGHNPLEPAALSVPVLTGPHWENFAEVYPRLLHSGAACQVNGPMELTERLDAWFGDPTARRVSGLAAKDVVAQGRGALDRIITLLSEVVAGEAEGVGESSSEKR